MRFRAHLSSVLFIVVFLAIPIAAQAAIPFFGPIIEKSWNECPLGWGAVISVINNIIQLLITIAIVFVAPLMIAWAGFLFVINPVNASGKEDAKKILTNTVVGIVIALSGWLIVDAVMAALYDRSAVGETWSDLIGSRGFDPCIKVAKSLKPAAPPSGVEVAPSVVGEATVTVNSGVIVSSNAINVLKNILNTAGLSSATITSGRRTSNDQARIMYGNLQADGVAKQKALYGSNGDAVIDVYAVQKQSGANEATIKAAMQQKIEQLGCSNVSNHCSTNDVFDVAPSSISNDSAFRTAVQNSSSVKKYIFPPTDPAYHIEL